MVTSLSGAGSLLAERRELMFPTLTAAQIARIAAHGRRRPVARGDVLLDRGEESNHFFVVTAGAVEIVQGDGADATVLIVHHPGQFTGELHMLSGRRSLARARVLEAGEVIEVDRETLRTLVQTDGELSEILMRA